MVLINEGMCIMRKFLSILSILLVSVLSTACINNLAVQELNNKAKVFMDKGDYENAISRLEASVDLDDTIFETQYNLAVAYTYANNYKEAIETFGKAINLKPTMAETYYSLGVAQENFAIDVIKGEVNINGEKPSDDEVEEQDNANANANEDSTELSKEDKEAVKELYNQAIQSYETYLQKAGNPKDRGNVEAKISNIKTEIKKIDDPNYEDGSASNVNENKSFSIE